MKMSKVAKLVGVDRRTIYNWVTNPTLTHLFSEEARSQGSRELDESDTIIANTINYLRQHMTTEWEEIADRIEEGFRITDLPLSATEVDTGQTPLHQFTRTITLTQERDAALKQLAEAQEALKQMEAHYEARLEQLRDQYETRLEDERQRGRGEMERLLREIAELRYEIGKLESDKQQPDSNTA